jgi:hypothetical protein
LQREGCGGIVLDSVLSTHHSALVFAMPVGV